MTTFSLIFIALVILTTAFRLWLSLRHTSHVGANRDRVPGPFSDSISLQDHQKAADYTRAKGQPSRISAVLDGAVLLGWTLGGGLMALDALVSGLITNELLAGAVFLVAIFIVNALIDLPISAWTTFGIEQRFGFNRTTPGTFFADLFKSLILLILIGLPLALAALWFMENSGTFWWLYVWLTWSIFILFMTWAWPTFIAPLFNTFKPLEKEELKNRIEALLSRCGFRSKGIFVMDGSRRSAHGNAYFTGIGSSKRIVFFDTLMDSLSDHEIIAVLAHELGHFRLNHVKKRLALSLLGSLAFLALLGWLAAQPWFFNGLGVETPSNHMALALFILTLPVFTFFLIPLGAWYSRRHEFEADAYAIEHANRDDMINALVSLYRENASTLTPDPVFSAFYDSHPPAMIRITHLQRAGEK